MKILPELPRKDFEMIMQISKTPLKQEVEEIWGRIGDRVYDESKDSDGTSSYYSPNIVKEDADFVNEFLKENNAMNLVWNTRLWKNKQNEYIIKIPSLRGHNMLQQF